MIYLTATLKKRNKKENDFANQHATDANTKTDKTPDTDIQEEKESAA